MIVTSCTNQAWCNMFPATIICHNVSLFWYQWRQPIHEKHNIHADSFKKKFLSLKLIYLVKHQKYVYFLLHIYLNRSLLKLNWQSTYSFCIGTIVVKFAGSPLWSLQLLYGVISCVRIPRDQIPFQIEVQTHAELHSWDRNRHPVHNDCQREWRSSCWLQ